MDDPKPASREPRRPSQVTGLDVAPKAPDTVITARQLKYVLIVVGAVLAVAVAVAVLMALSPDPSVRTDPASAAVPSSSGGDRSVPKEVQPEQLAELSDRTLVDSPLAHGNKAELKAALLRLQAAGKSTFRDRLFLVDLHQEEGELEAADALLEGLRRERSSDTMVRLFSIRQQFLRGSIESLDTLKALVEANPELTRAPAYPAFMQTVAQVAGRASRLAELDVLVPDEAALRDESLLQVRLASLIAGKKFADARRLLEEQDLLDEQDVLFPRARIEFAAGEVEKGRLIVREGIARAVSLKQASRLVEIANQCSRIGAPVLAHEAWSVWRGLGPLGELPLAGIVAHGYASLRVGKTAEASVLFKEAASRPGSGDAIANNAVYLQLLLGENVPRAAVEAEDRLGARPDNPNARALAMFARLKTGRISQAAELADQPLLLPRQPAVILGVALVEQARGNAEKARELAAAVQRRALLPEEAALLDGIIGPQAGR